MNKIVFLGGIHGTGKGFISETICNNIPLEYLSASQLIKWSEISPDVQNKSVANISDTQDRLITALRAFSNENKNYLLDGHYCLLNSNQEPTRIPLKIFYEINPVALLIIIVEPELIRQRLVSRDNRDYDISLIKEMQSIEKDYAQEISFKLQVPLYVINETNIKEVLESIKKHL